MGCEWIYNEFKWGGVGDKRNRSKEENFFWIENLNKIAVGFLPCYKPTGILDG